MLAQLEARNGLKKPILIHAILETAEGVKNVEAIAAASPRMHGMSLGPADLAASRAMKTTRVGGGHPEYKVLADKSGEAPRTGFQQDLWHYTIAKMVDACASCGIKAFYGPVRRLLGCGSMRGAVPQRVPDGVRGRLDAAPFADTLARRVFSPDPGEVAFARRILDAMPDGSGAVMIEGKMQDDATWKQAKVMVDLARQIAARDPERAALYGL